MSQLVVTIRPDGSLETLLKDKVLDTRKFADTRKIERLSEILPTDDGQEFYVRWLKGPLSEIVAHPAGTNFYSMRTIHCHDNGETVYFNSYEAAVECEIATVNALRLKGYSFT